MRDKSLGTFLMILFGISGMAVLVLAWLWPTLESDRIMATLVGSAGLLVALTQAPMFRRSPGRTDNKPTIIKVGTEERS